MNIEPKDIELLSAHPGTPPVPKPRRGHGGRSTDNMLISSIHGAPQWAVLVRDTTVALLDHADPRAPSLLSEVDVGTPFRATRGLCCQRLGDLVCIGDRRGYVLLDVSDPSSASVAYALREDSQRVGSWFTEEEVVFSYYLNRGDDPKGYRRKNGCPDSQVDAYPEGDGLFRQPLRGGPETIEAIPSKKKIGKFHHAVDTSSGALLVTQDGLAIYDRSKGSADTGKRWSLFDPDVVRLGPDHALALEQIDGKFAARCFDLRPKKPKLVADCFKKHWVVSWATDAEGAVWMLMGTEKRGSWRAALGKVGLDLEAQGPWELPESDHWFDTLHMAADDGVVRLWLPASMSQLVTLS